MIRIFRVLVPISALALLFGDLVLITLSYLAAVFLDPDLDIEIFLDQSGTLYLFQVVAILFAGFYLQDFYDRVRTRTRTAVFQQICFSIGLAFLIQALVSGINPDWVLPRKVMMVGSVLTMVGVFGWHVFFQAALGDAADSSQRMIFLGASPAVFELAAHLKTNPGLGLFPAGYLDRSPAPDTDGIMPWLGPAARYLEVFDAQEPEWIIIGRPEELRPWWVDDFLELRFGGVQVERVDTLFEESLGRVSIKQMRPSDLISWNPFEPALGARLQIVVSAGAAVLLTTLVSPIMVLVALLTKLNSRGPILTRTQVVGLHDQPFAMYRFRCATEDANGNCRMTPLGRLLHRTRLDCLPQLFNVIAGNMAFIGPSPQRVEYSERLKELIPFYSQRHITRPGLIGWAKLRSAPADNTLRTLEYDLYYVKNAAQNTIVSIDFLVLAWAIKAPWR